jgi:hypothetical protein
MDQHEFKLADLAIKELDAQERIIDANVAMYPHMSRDSGEKFKRGLHKLAYPDQGVVKKITPEQLKGMGFG